MNDRLHPILEAKRRLVADRKAATPLPVLRERILGQSPPRGFADALRSRANAGRYGLIAEMKRASPSRGLIRGDFDAALLARAYQAGGAACLSVLTDTHFQGRDEDLITARGACTIPILRKDFIIDEYQIFESRALGADCILLIMAALSDIQAKDYLGIAVSLGMDALVEIHDVDELRRAIALQPEMIGINNRNLKTLKVDIDTSLELTYGIPAGILPVAESGLSTPADLTRMAEKGIYSFLIGEALLRHNDVEYATRTLLVDRP
jgi:indole-3-glycerol phosphate synthase